MRQISASLFTFLFVVLGTARCVPSAPGIQGLATGGASGADAHMSVADAATEPQRPDAALPSRPDALVDKPRDLGSDVRPDLADARAEASGKEAGVDATKDAADAPRAPGDATSPEVRAARAPRAGEIAIDELLVDPAGNDLGHEWLEISNVTQEALDLTALHVADDAAEVAVDAGVLAPHALLVLGQSADRAHNGDVPVERAYGTRLTFNNGAERVTLCVGPCADGVVLATFAWTAAFGADYVGHAVVVTGGGTTCPATEPYGAGTDFGTPGRANPACGAPPPDAGSP